MLRRHLNSTAGETVGLLITPSSTAPVLTVLHYSLGAVHTYLLEKWNYFYTLTIITTPSACTGYYLLTLTTVISLAPVRMAMTTTLSDYH